MIVCSDLQCVYNKYHNSQISALTIKILLFFFLPSWPLPSI